MEIERLNNIIKGLREKLNTDKKIDTILNKIDMKNADIKNSSLQIKELLGCQEDEIINISAKTGEGVDEVVNAIINTIPYPSININDSSFKALIFD